MQIGDDTAMIAATKKQSALLGMKWSGWYINTKLMMKMVPEQSTIAIGTSSSAAVRAPG